MTLCVRRVTAAGVVEKAGTHVQVRLAPSSDSARIARRAVSEFLVDLGRDELLPSVALIVSELVANAIMHARTEMLLSLELVDDCVRVAVTDGSSSLPRWIPASPTATSGRGLLLVERLSRSWGVDRLPAGGKAVWAQVDEESAADDSSAPDDLLELWSDEVWPAHPGADAAVDVELDIDVRAMLDSRAHTDDLVRELQLTLLNAAYRVTTSTATDSVLRLARRLDSANEEFHEARLQILSQALWAAKHRQERTTLQLRLHRSDAAAARRWLEALDEADALASAGALLLPRFPPALTSFRQGYIGAIIEQIDAFH
jgi:anti-sigma regulatory factor (Ser/Thr protein kinase)